ncbi:MAG: response regulator [Bacteroidota bacterium]
MKANRTILIIEDDESVMWLLKHILSDYNVKSFKMVDKAINWLSNGFRPDLIISDLSLPGLHGYDLIKNLKRSGLYSDIPLIILSASLDDKTRETSLALGADDFFTKPFNPDSFTKHIDYLTYQKKVA